jgi:hypothetical protein
MLVPALALRKIDESQMVFFLPINNWLFSQSKNPLAVSGTYLK